MAHILEAQGQALRNGVTGILKLILIAYYLQSEWECCIKIQFTKSFKAFVNLLFYAYLFQIFLLGRMKLLPVNIYN